MLSLVSNSNRSRKLSRSVLFISRRLGKVMASLYVLPGLKGGSQFCMEIANQLKFYISFCNYPSITLIGNPKS